jgi:hypothetical protein
MAKPQASAADVRRLTDSSEGRADLVHPGASAAAPTPGCGRGDRAAASSALEGADTVEVENVSQPPRRVRRLRLNSSAPWSLQTGPPNARTQGSSSTSIQKARPDQLRWAPHYRDIPASAAPRIGWGSSVVSVPRGSLSSKHGQPGKKVLSPSLEAAIAYTLRSELLERVMRQGSCYCSKTFRAACKRLGLHQIFTRPIPEDQRQSRATNRLGKGYARAYPTGSATAELPYWLSL